MTAHRRPKRRATFPARLRLRATSDFLPIYKSAARVNVGPLLFYGMPNQQSHPRLGLSVSRRVGTAVKRNRIKRLLRESFRITQHDWPAAYDVVVSVRPHEPMRLGEYQQALAKAMRSLHQTWTRKKNNVRPDNAQDPSRES